MMVVAMASAFDNGDGTGPDAPDDATVTNAVCLYNSCTSCSTQNAQCQQMVSMMGGEDENDASTENMDLTTLLFPNATCPEDVTCAAPPGNNDIDGEAMVSPCTTTTNKEVSKAGEISYSVFVASMLAVIASMRVVAK